MAPLQVRSRRHAARAEQQEQQEREALQSAFHIYDLVCTDVDEGAAAARVERRRQAKERAAKAASEGAILMNYMPMVGTWQAEFHSHNAVYSHKSLLLGLDPNAHAIV